MHRPLQPGVIDTHQPLPTKHSPLRLPHRNCIGACVAGV